MELCGAEHPDEHGVTCNQGLDHQDSVHLAALGVNHVVSWPNEDYIAGPASPRTIQEFQSTALKIARNSEDKTHAMQPPSPINAPVGNQHPDVSREAATKATRGTATQRSRVCLILGVAGPRGLPADNISLLYNEFFQPLKRIANEMASRLQELRGESKESRHVIDPPWVEYIKDCQPLDKERLDKDGRLERINCNGNYALCQRLTDVIGAWQAADECQNIILGKYGAEDVDKFKQEIHNMAGDNG